MNKIRMNFLVIYFFKYVGFFGQFYIEGQLAHNVKTIIPFLFMCVVFIGYIPLMIYYIICDSPSLEEKSANYLFLANCVILVFFIYYGPPHLKAMYDFLKEINRTLCSESKRRASYMELFVFVVLVLALVGSFGWVLYVELKSNKPIRVLHLVDEFLWTIYEHGYIIGLFILHWSVTNRISYQDKDLYSRVKAGIRDILDNSGDINQIKEWDDELNKRILMRNSINKLHGLLFFSFICHFILNTLFYMIFLCGSGSPKVFKKFGFPINHLEKLGFYTVFFILTDLNENWYNFDNLLIELKCSRYADHHLVRRFEKTVENYKEAHYTIYQTFTINIMCLGIVFSLLGPNLINVKGVSFILFFILHSLINSLN